MILHRPLGGHPYRVEPDQRWPVHPVVGQPWELRVAATDAGPLIVEVDIDGATSEVSMTVCDLGALYDAGDATDGHLMESSRAVPDMGGATVWRAELGPACGQVVRYRFRGADDVSPWFRVCPARWEAADAAVIVGADDHMIAESVEWLLGADGPVAVRFALGLQAEEHVVGFGERFDRLDQRGAALDTMVFEQYQRQGNRTYLPSPFAVVTSSGLLPGWGLHVRTSRRVTFDVGATHPGRLQIELGVDPAHPNVELRMYDGHPAAVIAAHLAETGEPLQPPDWVFTPWMSGNEWNTQARVESEVAQSIAHDIPVGVVVIEAWSDESTFTAFRDAQYHVHPDGTPHLLSDMTFPADGAWPDPVGMVSRLHEQGVRVLLWQIPLVPTDRGTDGQVAADAATLVERGWCVKNGDGEPYRNRGWWFPGALLPDWTNPDATQWWLSKRRYLLDEVGIDGFKTDGGEHAWGDDLSYHDGTTGAVTNNLFAQHYAAAYHELLRSTGTHGVTFSRAGFTGAGTTPCHWAGDESSTWEGMRASIVAGQSAGLSGVLWWGWDLAGFSGEIPTVELWARATAFAALCPIMQYHSEFNHGRLPSRDRTPWNLASRHGDPYAADVYRWWAHLRLRLQPYLVDQSRRCVERYEALLRAMCIDHPDDPQIWSFPTQYQLGTELLVAPVCHPGVRSLDVYLPAGDWYDVWTGAYVPSGVVTVDVPLHRCPVFARGDVARWQDIFGAEWTGPSR